jgi:general secretion pathway protein G
MNRRHGPAARPTARGFALFELAVAAVVVAVLAGTLLHRLAPYAGQSEVVAAKQLIHSLRTALALRSAQAAASGGRDALLAISRENPVDWLARRPENYLGEYYSPDMAELPKGNWYFDKASRTLVYLAAAPKSFSAETSKFLRFKVELLRVPETVEPDGRITVTEGLVLAEVDNQTVATTNTAGLIRAIHTEKK